ncbi:MAG: hypothetical protein KatS3mg076_1662 [Candidatus Binatia bacterium]|nr:MAG: hypothetical protein KatS3mg076_1662 [Candidatus Binatia bacterium]
MSIETVEPGAPVAVPRRSAGVPGTGVPVALGVGVAVGVAVTATVVGVNVGVTGGLGSVGVRVGVRVGGGTSVGVRVTVRVGVRLGGTTSVGVRVKVRVGVAVRKGVSVGVCVRVRVGDGTRASASWIALRTPSSAFAITKAFWLMASGESPIATPGASLTAWRIRSISAFEKSQRFAPRATSA